jgi:hypothetical protein
MSEDSELDPVITITSKEQLEEQKSGARYKP